MRNWWTLTRPELNLNRQLTPGQYHQPQLPIRPGRCSISLEREAGACLLEARI